ncbi:MAG TPA: lysophospholipid acyltransferase family protein [Candidatus Limnocylindrales bacterium]
MSDRRPHEAPHRRRQAAPRIVERAAVRAYRAAEWALGHTPQRLAWTGVALATQAAYLAWPQKRRWVDRNFGHVLGLPPGNRQVRRLALAAYRNYARYIVELMQLSSMPPEAATAQIDPHGLETFEEIRAQSKGLIFVAAHVGNNEAIAAGLARHGWPVSVVADDSTFPELFEHLRAIRESWGVRLIPWRNLREVYGVLKRGEMLGLLVDWGYKPDGIPVRLFDAPTMLPAGPAYLAAKSGATILPIAVRRHGDGHFFVTHDEPITVASTDDAALAEATQRIADALERTIAAAPEQWYSFKPIWPDEPAEVERVERAHRTAVAREVGAEAR